MDLSRISVVPFSWWWLWRCTTSTVASSTLSRRRRICSGRPDTSPSPSHSTSKRPLTKSTISSGPTFVTKAFLVKSSRLCSCRSCQALASCKPTMSKPPQQSPARSMFFATCFRQRLGCDVAPLLAQRNASLCAEMSSAEPSIHPKQTLYVNTSRLPMTFTFISLYLHFLLS